ncbi:heavy-metal-associated domain-containing protein [Noviherbaspirillum autotrophicum]|uniref:Copper-binding protein n=1 Tax=Noviherbaspirillum autotrophicum TaxID=709839 RepID=A0A0C2BTI7_9BURK|nr:cation transporter [Noviherbaspirillum autotrophicum]KIF83339.1 copper-binding protein [Noviherbaspirillum autotrophicum]
MYELKVEGMSCNHCVNAVTRSVQEVDAAAKVDIDLSQQTVRVASSASLAAIQSAVSEAGYPVLSSSAS